MKVHESEFLTLSVFKEEKLIEVTWKMASARMSVRQFKEEFLNYLKIILEFRPQKNISDTREMQFLITPSLQEWTNEHIFPVSLEIGLNKVAMVVSKALISQISIEQTMEEAGGKKFITRYFEDKAAAMNWILSV